MTHLQPGTGTPGAFARYGATALVSFAFYMLLGDPTSLFDLVTGLVSAAVVAAVLGEVTFDWSPSTTTVASLARAVVFLPWLLVAVVRSTVGLTLVVLDPRLPIDPKMVRIPAPESRLGRALLANSITLTPGTLTVDVVDDELVVHTLTTSSCAELLAGSITNAVAFVTGETVTESASQEGRDE
ncbi:Na+/H+ antiporter subunit E [Haloarchaeobius sp. DFWS5]|uniref:Na+/H+ antiporter subunit E n=1 Tax=Haloarchaeobius sp. DFWS5 TaxID=3446114 RepID=UPI003EB8E26B